MKINMERLIFQLSVGYFGASISTTGSARCILFVFIPSSQGSIGGNFLVFGANNLSERMKMAGLIKSC